MGKRIIIPDVSFATNAIGKADESYLGTLRVTEPTTTGSLIAKGGKKVSAQNQKEIFINVPTGTKRIVFTETNNDDVINSVQCFSCNSINDVSTSSGANVWLGYSSIAGQGVDSMYERPVNYVENEDTFYGSISSGSQFKGESIYLQNGTVSIAFYAGGAESSRCPVTIEFYSE